MRDLRGLLSGAGDRQPGAVGSRANRLRWWVCFSGALHLALIVTLLVVPTSTARRDLPVPVYTVDLVAGNMPAPRPEPPKAAPARFEAPPLQEEEENFFEPPAPEPPKAAVAPPKPPPPPKVKEQVKKPPKPKEPPAKKVKKAPEKPKKKVVKRKKPAKPKKKVVKQKKSPSSKVAKKKPRAKRAPKAVAKVAKKTPKASKPKSTADSRLAERVRRRRIDDALATARERARLRREARAGQKSGAGIGTAGGGNGGGVRRGMEFVAYLNQMHRIFKERWTWFDKRRGLQATVGFGVHVDGEIFGLKLLKRSGDAAYDESVLWAVRRSSPLPPPPKRYAREFGEVEFTFKPDDADG